MAGRPIGGIGGNLGISGTVIECDSWVFDGECNMCQIYSGDSMPYADVNAGEVYPGILIFTGVWYDDQNPFLSAGMTVGGTVDLLATLNPNFTITWNNARMVKWHIGTIVTGQATCSGVIMSNGSYGGVNVDIFNEGNV